MVRPARLDEPAIVCCAAFRAPNPPDFFAPAAAFAASIFFCFSAWRLRISAASMFGPNPPIATISKTFRLNRGQCVVALRLVDTAVVDTAEVKLSALVVVIVIIVVVRCRE